MFITTTTAAFTPCGGTHTWRRPSSRKIVAQEPPHHTLAGKFWAPSTDSDDKSEVDDLGDAEMLAMKENPMKQHTDRDPRRGDSNPKARTEVHDDVHAGLGLEPRVPSDKHPATKKHDATGVVMKKMDSSPPGIRWPWVKPLRGPLTKRHNTVITLADYVGIATPAKSNSTNTMSATKPPIYGEPALATVAGRDPRMPQKSISKGDGPQ